MCMPKIGKLELMVSRAISILVLGTVLLYAHGVPEIGGIGSAVLVACYSSLRTVAYDFDRAGRVKSVTGTPLGAATKTYVTAIDYAAHGAMEQMSLGTAGTRKEKQIVPGTNSAWHFEREGSNRES